MDKHPDLPSEQLRFASVLHWLTLLGFIVLVVTFAAYLMGWLPAFVPPEQLPKLWNLSAAEYIKATNTPIGWSWLFRMGQGDFAGQLGIAILSGCSIACTMVIIPIYAKNRNAIYVTLCVLEIAVLLASASGVFSRH